MFSGTNGVDVDGPNIDVTLRGLTINGRCARFCTNVIRFNRALDMDGSVVTVIPFTPN